MPAFTKEELSTLNDVFIHQDALEDIERRQPDLWAKLLEAEWIIPKGDNPNSWPIFSDKGFDEIFEATKFLYPDLY